MAVAKMNVISMIGDLKELDAVTEVCGNSGVFHPDNTLSFYSNTAKFSPLNEENPYQASVARLTEMAGNLGLSLPLLKERELEAFSMTDDAMRDYVRALWERLTDLQKTKEEARQAIGAYNRSITNISHFVGMKLDFKEILSCKYIKVRFGSLPRESFDKLPAYQENPYIIFFPCTQDATHYWGVYFAPVEVVSEVDRIFSGLYFERLRLTDIAVSPEDDIQKLQTLLEQEESRVRAAEEAIGAFWKKEQKTCAMVYTKLVRESTFFGIRRYAARYENKFCLTGWIPQACKETFKKQLDALETVGYTLEDAKEELPHSPPVQLNNQKLFRPFEFFVDMYGLPSYDEVDPTPFVAMTYVLLFGIMFGDLGQGLLVALIGALAWRLKGMKLGRALVPCGLSSAFFGLIYGSVFGFEHALNPLYRLLFGLENKPVEVMEPATTNLIIYGAVGIGFVLVMLAMLINIYSSLRRKHYENALFGPNGLAGLVFYVSLVLGLLSGIVFGKSIMTVPYVLGLIVLPLLVIFLREVLGALLERRPDKLPESIGDYIMQNFFELFEVLLSYASNTMSFLRVGAFVLVHAGMMLVVFTLAEMASGLAYVLVVVAGNLIVMCLEGLLVGIQVLRLEYYEMFSRFFDGQGRPFQPVVVKKD